MRKLIVIFFLLLCSCGTPAWFITNSMQEHTYINVDSVCLVDSLPTDINQWIPLTLKDYEDNTILNKYIFIRDSITYIRTDSNIVKRW